ncbi:penicillin-binding transpeptidase domain-containing protein [Vandammella animalimorsus]|nr:penicillin-binding transpeptidase domain-containing protein [Vandammella animalimorsus]
MRFPGLPRAPWPPAVRVLLNLYALPLLLCLLVLVAAVTAAWHMRQWRWQSAAPDMPATAALQQVPAELQGQQVDLPTGAGLWTRQLAGRPLLLVRAAPDQAPRRIHLCQQRTLRQDDPARLYPLALLPDWEALVRRKSGTAAHRHEVARSPLVIGPGHARGMPALLIEGRSPGELTVRASTADAGKGGAASWTLVFGSHSQPGQARKLGLDTWLLWQPLGIDDSSVPASGSLESAWQGFAKAIRVRRIQKGPQALLCEHPSGDLLELTLYTAVSQPGGSPAPGGARLLWQAASGALTGLPVHTARHVFAAAPAPRLEDRVLFEALLAQGLVRTTESGLLDWAPADALRAQRLGQAVPGWESIDFTAPGVAKPLRALHTSDNGRFVLSQMQRHRQQGHWLALRLRAAPGLPQRPEQWQAQVNGQQVPLTSDDMPDATARLFSQLPRGWGPWLRLAAWPEAGAGVAHLQTTLPASWRERVVELLTLGAIQGVDGAALLSSYPACDGSGCQGQADMLWLTRLRITATTLRLRIVPEQRFARLSTRGEFTHIRRQGGRLAWQDRPAATPPAQPQAEVTLLARDGTPLFAAGQPSQRAWELGLTPLVGLSRAHGESLAGVLSRLGAHGHASVQATTTIAPVLQDISQQVLECVGHRQGRWEAAQRQCVGGHAEVPAQRRSALVWLDAENGDILAAAGAPLPAREDAVGDLLAFDRFNPSASALQVPAWQHTGGHAHSPGSTFKLVDALALEQWAMGRPERIALLNGADAAQWNALGKPLSFAMQASCYPSHCPRQRAIRNFRGATPAQYAGQGRFGVAKALEQSVNTWFAWMIERADEAIALQADAQPLGSGALLAQRPLWQIAGRLGFGRSQALDGGLLPPGFAWRPGDRLRTTASAFDDIANAAELRAQAIGQRIQATPLQMAQVAAAIASGRPVTPRLLLALGPAQAAAPAPAAELGLPLGRIRQGMQAVVASGTAASAFSATPGLRQIRGKVHGKTGTAAMRGDSAEMANDNVAWFVGYVEPGALPGQVHPMAFALSVTHSSQLGGNVAQVVAGILETLAAAPAAPAPEPGANGQKAVRDGMQGAKPRRAS